MKRPLAMLLTVLVACLIVAGARCAKRTLCRMAVEMHQQGEWTVVGEVPVFVPTTQPMEKE